MSDHSASYSEKRSRLRSPDTNRTGPHVAAQVAASWAALDATQRAGNLAAELGRQDTAFLSAMREMQVVHHFVGSPGNILGSAATKHGEIAEQVNVGVTRAFDALYGRAPSVTFEGVPRLGPVDFRMDGVDIQSKYYNGLRNTLGGITSHSTKYPGFASGDGAYQIPRDQHQQMGQVIESGRIDGLSDRSSNAISDRLDALHRQTGRSSEDMIRRGETTYSEVQQGRVHDTIRDREGKLSQQDEELRRAAQVRNGPTLSGLGTAAAGGAAAGGGVRLAQALWVKHREGRNPFNGQFTAQDWKDVGVVTAQGAGDGAIAGGALYLVTNSTNLAAPFAGAMVSGLMGIGELLRQYHSGQIGGDQFAEMSQIVAADAAIVGLASLAGQTLIPIPLVGALIGSLAGKFVASAIKDGLAESESELIAELAAYEKRANEQLDREYQALLQRLDAYFGNLEHLASVAFDNAANTALRLQASVEFAETVGVPDDLILRSTDDLDAFILE